MTRLDYGFARTVCACNVCRVNCRWMSGVVTPSDLARWRRDGMTEEWLLSRFAASPGALVASGTGDPFRIRTIVPFRLPDGRCTFLGADERCGIHATSPYGCAVFDCTMTVAEGDERSTKGLIDIAYDWSTDGPYATLWRALWERGSRVEAPEVARARMAAAQSS